mgnify:CR=1 FL=1
MRYIGIDLGTRRIGLAFGDELGVATPLPALTSADAGERRLALLKVIGAVYLGCLLHVLGVYSSLLILLARLNPLHYFKSIVDAQAVAFTSSSSSSTLPISLACAERRLGYWFYCVRPKAPPASIRS